MTVKIYIKSQKKEKSPASVSIRKNKEVEKTRIKKEIAKLETKYKPKLSKEEQELSDKIDAKTKEIKNPPMSKRHKEVIISNIKTLIFLLPTSERLDLIQYIINRSEQ